MFIEVHLNLLAWGTSMTSLFKRFLSVSALVGASFTLLSTAAGAADLLATVKQKKEIVIGTEAQYAPFEFIQDGKIVGYSADLLAVIMADLPGVVANRQDVPFQAILPGLAARKFDFIVTAVTLTKERDEKFAFTLPIAEATVAILRRARDTNIKGVADLDGKVVGSQAGSAQLKVAKELDARLKKEGKAGFKEIKEYVAFDEAYADLAAGRLDGVMQSMANLGPLVKSRGDTFAVVTPTVGPKTYFGWVGRKDADSAALVKFFSDGIAKANKNGKMAELQKKWFGFTMDVPADKVPEPQM
jgi:polar amino acid transport system substrate-binding protein